MKINNVEFEQCMLVRGNVSIAYVCNECVEKHGLNSFSTYIQDNPNGEICGLNGCNRLADKAILLPSNHNIDLNVQEIEDLKLIKKGLQYILQETSHNTTAYRRPIVQSIKLIEKIQTYLVDNSIAKSSAVYGQTFAIKFFIETYADSKVLEYFDPKDSMPVGLLTRAHDYGFVVVELDPDDSEVILKHVKEHITYVEAEEYLEGIRKGEVN